MRVSVAVACDNFQTVFFLPDITLTKPEVHINIMPQGWHQKVMLILATF